MFKEKPTTSPFVAGAEVAVIESYGHSHRTVTKRTIGRVRKDGKFYLQPKNPDEKLDTKTAQMWTPDKYPYQRTFSSEGGKGGWTWLAHESGARFSRKTISPWGEEHDAELASNDRERENRRVCTEIITALGKLDLRNPDTTAKLAAIKKELGL